MSQLEHEAEVNILKKSKEGQGYIYPAIVDKVTLEVVDGRHRKEADPNWPELQVEFKTPKDRLLYRIHANMARRDVSRKERGAQLTELALILEEEGVPREQIAQGVAKLVPFFSERYVLQLLPSKYKSEEKRKAALRGGRPRVLNSVQQPAVLPPSGTTQPSTGTAAPTPAPKPKPITTVTCPFCHVKSEKVLCSTCWRDIEVKDIEKQ